MGALLDRVAGSAELAAAWKRVLGNDAEDETLSAGVRRFADDADTQLALVADELSSGSYRPRPLTEIVIPKDDGGERVLGIPSVRDRVVERAVLAVLTPLVDPLLGPSSFAYRPGLGVVDAIQQVARLRDEGFAWVLRTDIDDCSRRWMWRGFGGSCPSWSMIRTCWPCSICCWTGHRPDQGCAAVGEFWDCRRDHRCRRCWPTWPWSTSTTGCGWPGSRSCATPTI